IPAPGDNVAIATRRLPAGTSVEIAGARVASDYTILEGHRFAIAPIPAGRALLSWGLPFGYAICDIAPGAYVHNAKILPPLRGRAHRRGRRAAEQPRPAAADPCRLRRPPECRGGPGGRPGRRGDHEPAAAPLPARARLPARRCPPPLRDATRHLRRRPGAGRG